MGVISAQEPLEIRARHEDHYIRQMVFLIYPFRDEYQRMILVVLSSIEKRQLSSSPDVTRQQQFQTSLWTQNDGSPKYFHQLRHPVRPVAAFFFFFKIFLVQLADIKPGQRILL